MLAAIFTSFLILLLTIRFRHRFTARWPGALGITASAAFLVLAFSGSADATYGTINTARDLHRVLAELGILTGTGTSGARTNGTCLLTGGANCVMTKMDRNTPLATTVAEDGTGSAATSTIAVASFNEVISHTCNDDAGCAITMSETSAVTGDQVQIEILGNLTTMADSSGVQELQQPFTGQPYENISLRYIGDRWVEIGRTTANSTDTVTLVGDINFTQGGGEQVKFNKSATDATADKGVELNYTALDTTAGTTGQYALYLNNVASTEGADALLVLDNSDSDDNVLAAIQIDNPTRFTSHFSTGNAAIVYGASVTDSHTLTCDSTGDGEVVVCGESIGAGEILNLTRSVPLPLDAWVNCTTPAALDFSSGADDDPDIIVSTGVISITYDDTGGSVDADEICTTFTVPADYASEGSFTARVTQDASTAGNEGTFSCRISVDGAAVGAANAGTIADGTSAQTVTSTPAGTWAAGAAIAVSCKQGNASADDIVLIHSIEGRYTAVQ